MSDVRTPQSTQVPPQGDNSHLGDTFLAIVKGGLAVATLMTVAALAPVAIGAAAMLGTTVYAVYAAYAAYAVGSAARRPLTPQRATGGDDPGSEDNSSSEDESDSGEEPDDVSPVGGQQIEAQDGKDPPKQRRPTSRGPKGRTTTLKPSSLRRSRKLRPSSLWRSRPKLNMWPL